MHQQRHLAAILFTDIVGYTAMMQENEMRAVAMVKRYHSVLQAAVTAHSGEILNDYGDGSLCTFPSAIEAVQAALELQEKLKEESSVPLRIGLHIGEIFFEDGKVFGDGVNIASRIQSLGQANTILLSGEINNKIRNHPELSSVSLGRFAFKNVKEEVEVFALANPGLVIPKKESMTGKLKETGKKFSGKKLAASASIAFLFIAGLFVYTKFQHKSKFTGDEKSIAVLPFNNMSSDKENEYFSDGMTEEITTQLSKIADLKVIARTSAMLYKGSKKSIKQIAEELGVSAILEGSVQKAGNAIRITAQLIDANSQEHIWADKYDRDFKDVFAVQSEVAQAIAYQLNAKLTKEEKSKLEKIPTNNPEAYKYYLQGYQLHTRYWENRKREYFENSRAMFKRAIELDSNYALAHAGIADLFNSYTNYDPNFLKKDSFYSLMLSLQQVEIEKAWKLDSTNDYVNYVKGTIEQTPLRHIDNGFRYLKRAIEINPNAADNLWGMALMIGGDFGMLDESALLFERVIKLDPLTANNFLFLGACHYLLNNKEKGIEYLETAIRLNPEFPWAMDWLAQAYVSVNRLDEAKRLLERSFALKPSPSEHWLNVVANVYAELGDKKKALELAPKDWGVLLTLGMKEEALKAMPYSTESDSTLNTPYLQFKSNLDSKYYQPVRNDPRFLKIFEKSKQKYEENKKKYSVMDLINSFQSSTP